MRSWLFLAAGAAVIAPGCGSPFTSSPGGGGATSTSASTSVSAAGTGGAGAGGCPQVHGDYTSMDRGGGCNSLDTNARQCIRVTSTACTFMFTSAGMKGIDGTVALDASGAFSDGTLTLGGAPHTGCTGSWDATQQAMTVTCAAAATAQTCTVTLKRDGTTCGP